jgi:hypothetical protein
MSNKGNIELKSFTHNLLIRSKDKKLSTDSNSDFYVDFRPNITSQRVVKRAVLRSITIPNVVYNINSNNNVLVLGDSAPADITLTITEGQYSLTELISAIETAWTASAGIGVLTITEDNITNKLTFANGSNIKLYNIEDMSTSTMSPYLGILNTVALASSTEATGLPDLSGLKIVYIKSKFLSDNDVLHDSGDNIRPIFCSVPCSVAYGSILYYEPNDTELTSVNFGQGKKISGNVDIQLLDQNFNEIDLKGLDAEIEFKLYHTQSN